MKKYFKFYIAAAAVFLLVATVFTFLVVPEITGTKPYPRLFMGYGFMLAAFCLEILSSYIFFNQNTYQRAFLAVPLFYCPYIALVITVCVNLYLIIFEQIPIWAFPVANLPIMTLSVIITIYSVARVERVEREIERLFSDLALHFSDDDKEKEKNVYSLYKIKERNIIVKSEKSSK